MTLNIEHDNSLPETPAEYTQMTVDLAKDGTDIIIDLTSDTAHLLHMAVGVAGESSEIVKALYLDDSENLLEECGDTEFYLEGIVRVHGIATHDDMRKWLSEAVGLPDFQPCSQVLVIVTGELLDLCKKASMYAKDIPSSKVEAACRAVRECLDAIYLARGWTRQKALDHNMNKLLTGKNARYKEGTFSNDAAQKRADKQELICINANGVDVELSNTEDRDSVVLGYEAICQACGFDYTKKLYTVTWVNGEGTNGSLVPDTENSRVIVARGNSLKFNVICTNNA